jgi:hypothetical protein
LPQRTPETQKDKMDTDSNATLISVETPFVKAMKNSTDYTRVYGMRMTLTFIEL